MFVDERDRSLLCCVIGLPDFYATSEDTILAFTRHTLSVLGSNSGYKWADIYVRDVYVLLTHSLYGEVIQPFDHYKIRMYYKIILIVHGAMCIVSPLSWTLSTKPLPYVTL